MPGTHLLVVDITASAKTFKHYLLIFLFLEYIFENVGDGRSLDVKMA